MFASMIKKRSKVIGKKVREVKVAKDDIVLTSTVKAMLGRRYAVVNTFFL